MLIEVSILALKAPQTLLQLGDGTFNLSKSESTSPSLIIAMQAPYKKLKLQITYQHKTAGSIISEKKVLSEVVVTSLENRKNLSQLLYLCNWKTMNKQALST
jgi:hypothetical protein